MSEYRDTNSGESSDAIKADIDRTRSDMSRKIDSIQDRLNPENLKQQAQDVMQSAVAEGREAVMGFFRENSGDFSTSLVDAVRRNPVPAALIGLGVAWLVWDSMSGSGQDDEEDYRWREDRSYGRQGYYGQAGYGPAAYSQRGTSQYSGYENTYPQSGNWSGSSMQGQSWQGQSGSGQSEGDSWRDKAADVVGQVKDTASDLVGQVKDTAGQVADKVKETAGQVAGQVRSGVNQVTDQTRSGASQLGNYAQQPAQWASNQMQSGVEGSPFMMGAAALAIGAIVGLVLPETAQENQVMGQLRDQVFDKAQSVAATVTDDVKQRVQTVVDEVKPQVEETASRILDNLKTTGQEVASDVKQVAQNASETAKREAQDATQKAKDEVKQALPSDQTSADRTTV